MTARVAFPPERTAPAKDRPAGGAADGPTVVVRAGLAARVSGVDPSRVARAVDEPLPLPIAASTVRGEASPSASSPPAYP